MSEQDQVAREIQKARAWFEIECRNGLITPKLKVSMAREIQKCINDHPTPMVKIALISLAMAGEIEDPLNLSQDDVENALWLVRDLRIGFDENAPVAVKYYQ
nr:hypothetical protein [uncultured Pseudomonas sp.]